MLTKVISVIYHSIRKFNFYDQQNSITAISFLPFKKIKEWVSDIIAVTIEIEHEHRLLQRDYMSKPSPESRANGEYNAPGNNPISPRGLLPRNQFSETMSVIVSPSRNVT